MKISCYRQSVDTWRDNVSKSLHICTMINDTKFLSFVRLYLGSLSTSENRETNFMSSLPSQWTRLLNLYKET